MLAITRRNKILELLKEEGGASVHKLSKIFNVSEPTIRQDLEKLEGS
jgi:DeoR/GlpR family transcriptional regulator of sugar metabolism